MDEVVNYGAEIIPCDSEHNAMFQCLAVEQQQQVVAGKGCSDHFAKIWLTASGGPFFNKNIDFSNITPQQACSHPNWQMGQKISIDSATMMNKGLEAIEACVLFGMDLEQLQIVIHPNSIVHSMVAFKDGSTLAQLSENDMAIPIQYAMCWPTRKRLQVAHLDLLEIAKLEFFAADYKIFPCLKLALQAYADGIESCVILNATNEVAVQAFLDNKIKYTDIAKFCVHSLERNNTIKCTSFDDIYQLDTVTRQQIQRQLQRQIN